MPLYKAATSGSGLTTLKDNQAPGASFTVETGKFRLHGKRLLLASAERITVEGTGRFILVG